MATSMGAPTQAPPQTPPQATLSTRRYLRAGYITLGVLVLPAPVRFSA